MKNFKISTPPLRESRRKAATSGSRKEREYKVKPCNPENDTKRKSRVCKPITRGFEEI